MPIDWETQPISIKSTVKIKRDAGVYGVWGVNWGDDTLYVSRTCGNGMGELRQDTVDKRRRKLPMPDDWLKSLKVGDEVCYNRLIVGKDYVITPVEKITLTGKIRTENGLLFDNDGFCRDSAFGGHYLLLRPVTEEIREGIRRYEIYKKLKCFNWEKLTTEQLEAIAEIAGVGE
jgi:hypothetical protein